MAPETITIETERLLLRVVTPEVFEQVMSTHNDDEIKTYFGYLSDNDLFKEKERFRQKMTCYYHTFRRFVIILKENNKAIGQAGYHKWYPEHSKAEIGYALYNTIHWNNGYMREAIAPIIAYGFNNMQLNRIEAFISPSNTASIKLVKRHGFVLEGVMREHYCKNGINEDSASYSLLRREYLQAK